MFKIKYCLTISYSNIVQSKYIILCFLFICFAKTANAQTASDYKWKNVQILAGGYITGIIYSPTEKNLVYVRTDVGGAYRWNAVDKIWVPITDDINADDSNFTGILSIATDPSDSKRVYLAAGLYTASWASTSAILASNNKGETWTRTKMSFKLGGNENGRASGERLQVDPNLGNILFCGTNNAGLWKSTDYAATWTKVTSFTAPGVTFVAFDKNTGTTGNATQTIYVGTNSAIKSLYRSTDGGVTWASVPGQPTGLMALRNSFNGTNLYLAYSDDLAPNGNITKGAIYKYNTVDDSWTNLMAPAGQGGFSSVSVDAQNPDNIIIGTASRWYPRDEIFRTSDGGKTWKGLLSDGIYDHSPSPYSSASTPHWIADVQIDPFNSNVAWFGTGYGLFSTDNLTEADQSKPVKWLFQNKGLEETVPLKLISPPSGALLVSAIGDIDGFRHDNIDVAPPEGRLSPRYGTNRYIDFAEKNPNIMVRTYDNSAGNFGAMSIDGGIKWTKFSSTPTGINSSGTIGISADGRSIVWNQGSNLIYNSTNNGVSWKLSTGISGNYVPIADRVNPNKFYVFNSNSGQLFSSNNSGSSFAVASSGMPKTGSVSAIFGYEGDLWHSAWENGLYHSTNSGVSFQKINTVQASNRVGFGKAAPGKNYPAVYIAGKVGGTYGFFRSDNAGTSWVRINDDEHQFGWINDIVGDPRYYGRVYLATGGRGIIYGQMENFDCNGDINGTATVNACDICVGGNTGLEVTAQCTNTVTGILDNQDGKDIFCYPNPFTEALQIDAKGKFNYTIWSLTGKLIESGSGNKSRSVGSKIAQGVYILIIDRENKLKKQFKILKK